MAHPIWKDFYFYLGIHSQEKEKFRIVLNGSVIYEGEAHRKPGASDIPTRINDICADYLKFDFPQVSDAFTPEGVVSFQIQVWDGETWEIQGQIPFYADWSYDYDFDPQRSPLNCPINGKISLLTPLPFSAIKAEELEIETDSNEVIYYYPTAEVAGTYMVNLAHFNVGNKLYVREFATNIVEYKIVDTCSKYALYYRNAYGGVDVFLIEGNHSETDNLTRHTRSVEYDNRSVSNRGRLNYVNEITKSLTLHTSWLSDDESSRMHHLLNSTDVYLFDLESQQMIPVLLKNTISEYKTYKGNGAKLVNYTIEVEFANQRIRK